MHKNLQFDENFKLENNLLLLLLFLLWLYIRGEQGKEDDTLEALYILILNVIFLCFLRVSAEVLGAEINPIANKYSRF